MNVSCDKINVNTTVNNSDVDVSNYAKISEQVKDDLHRYISACIQRELEKVVEKKRWS